MQLQELPKYQEINCDFFLCSLPLTGQLNFSVLGFSDSIFCEGFISYLFINEKINQNNDRATSARI